MKYNMILVLTLAPILSTGCISRNTTPDTSGAFQMSFNNSQAVSAASGDDLLAYLKSNGFYSTSAVGAGAKVYYSTSYETDDKGSSSAEAGQAYGALENRNGALMFKQQDMVTTQLLLCPGSSGGMSGDGTCQWRFDGPAGYLQLMYDVATAKASSVSASIHPGYKNMKVSRGAMNGGTAGGSVSYPDVVEVSLSGGESNTEIYFAKGVGPVAVEFRETTMPAGTAKVYIQSSGAASETSIPRENQNPT